MLQQAFKQLLAVFPESVLEQGMRSLKQDGVMNVRLSDGLLHARIKGLSGGLFDVYADLKTWPAIPTRCHCATRFNCEHAAASLLSLKIKTLDDHTQHPLDQWIHAFNQNNRLPVTPAQTHILLFYLRFTPFHVALTLATSKRLKTGKWGKKTWLHTPPSPSTACWQDNSVLLKALPPPINNETLLTDTQLLMRVLESDRAHHEETDKPWQAGDAREGTIIWRSLPDGSQYWECTSNQLTYQPCLLDHLLYVDTRTLEIGPLSLPYSLAQLSFLFAHRTVQPENIESFCEQARQHGDAIPLPSEHIQLIQESTLDWYHDFSESGHDFFSYELGIVVEGEKLNLIPSLVLWLQQYDLAAWEQLPDDYLFYVPITEGKILPLPAVRLRPLITFLLFDHVTHDASNRHLQLKRYQWGLLQEAMRALTAASSRWVTQETLFSQLAVFMAQHQLPDTTLPSTCLAALRDYQHQGLNWLQALRACHLGGILADDMGLGKTVQTLVHLLVEKEAGRLTRPALVIAPLSLIGNWLSEAARFTPTLRVLAHHGAKRSAAGFGDVDLILSTYGLIQRDHTLFTTEQFEFLILDEAQWIKNAKTKTTLIIQQIQATHRLCLSGTPFENHLGELWSLFHFLIPGLLGNKRQFKTYFQNPIEKEANQEKRMQLIKRIQPFLLRRTKSQVLLELPKKTEVIQQITLSGAQRDLYETIRISMEKKVREAIAKQGLNKSHLIVLDALLKLRQICCDPRLLSLPLAKNAHGSSAKLDALMNLIDVFIDEGRNMLIFSQFTSMFVFIEECLKKRGYPYLKLTGQTKDRQTLVERFQQGDIPIFLISLKAGGVGLNLTQADTVIHYDPWWNPAVEDQATDRTHRIGQQHPVFVYRLVATGTVEEAMMSMQTKKRGLFQSLLAHNEHGLSTLSEADIQAFFQPIG